MPAMENIRGYSVVRLVSRVRFVCSFLWDTTITLVRRRHLQRLEVWRSVLQPSALGEIQIPICPAHPVGNNSAHEHTSNFQQYRQQSTMDPYRQQSTMSTKTQLPIAGSVQYSYMYL